MMQASATLSDREVGTYLVFRMKMNELIHLHYLWLALKDGTCGQSISGIDKAQVMESLRTAAMAWFSTIVDKNGLDIFKLWESMFPQYRKRIDLYRSAVKPQMDVLRTFRNRTAFHAEREFAKFYEPRVKVLREAKDISKALQKFLHLAAFLVKREQRADPKLQSRFLDIVLNTELKLKCTIKRRALIDARIFDESSIFGTWRF